MSDDVEAFWNDAPDPSETGLTERLFLLDWKTFFDNGDLSKMCSMLTKQRDIYHVRVGHVPDERAAPHPLGELGVGWDILLVEPDVVGGYTYKNERLLFHVTRSEYKAELADTFYASIREGTVEFRENMTAADLRSEWLALHGIGQWDEQWSDVNDRSHDYFDHYDKHIRCWIPEYTQLIEATSAEVQRATSEILGAGTSPCDVLEIGNGTGALTERLLDWFEHLNRPLHARRLIGSYHAVDSSRRMQEMIAKKFQGRWPNISRHFRWGRAFEAMPPELAREKFHIVCGSLVLHDVIGDSDQLGQFTRFAEECSKILHPGGWAVFSDAFCGSDRIDRSVELEFWKRTMRQYGLTEDHIGRFFDHNKEMTTALGVDRMGSIAKASGFSEVRLDPPTRPHSPFRVLVLRK
jgi:SAM-dependent methyltransferase